MRFFEVIRSRGGRVIDFEGVEVGVKEICEEFNIELCYLFGSYAQGSACKLSDLDIGIFPQDEFDLDKTLSVLGKFQEIFEEEAIDLVDLRRAPLSLIHRVIKEGRCLYAKDLSKRIEFETQKETFYYDTEFLRKEYFNALKRRIGYGSFGYR